MPFHLKCSDEIAHLKVILDYMETLPCSCLLEIFKTCSVMNQKNTGYQNYHEKL